MAFKNLFSNLPVAELAQDHPINYFDIGSRGGFQKDLFPIAFAVNAVGFEPEIIALEKLKKKSNETWLTSNFLPFGISGRGGLRNLYITRDPVSSSLLKHNLELGAKFKKPQFFELDRVEKVQTRTLKEGLISANTGTIDYLKIDIEGAELEVFKSSSSLLNDVLAIKTEVSFVEFRKDQPLASDVDSCLSRLGFILMDFQQPVKWRREGYVVHPYTANETPPYSRGQIMQGDYLYFRSPETLFDHPQALVKLALISMAFGYFDQSKMILEISSVKNYISKRYDKKSIEYVNLASLKYGQHIFFKNIYSTFRNLVPLIRYSRNILKI